MNAGAAAESREKKRKLRRILTAGSLLVILAAIAISAGCVSRRMGALPEPEEYQAWERLPNFSGKTFQNLEPSPMNLKAIKKKSGMWRFLFQSVNAPRTFRIPQKPWSRDLFAGKDAGFSVYWLGHSSLIFELDGIRFMTDPVFGNASPVPFTVRRYCDPPMKREDIPPLDFLIISHDHYDHLEYDTIRAVRHEKYPIVTPLGVGARLRGWGVAPERIRELNWNESVTLGDTKVTAVPSRHFSGRSLKDRNSTLWASWVIERNGKKIFFGGDSAYGKHFKTIGKTYGPFDLACLEIDAWNEGWPHNHMFPHEFPVAAAELKAKLAMPIHWGVFDLAMHPWKESITMVAAEAKKAELPLFTPMMGEKAFPGRTVTSEWWADLPER